MATYQERSTASREKIVTAAIDLLAGGGFAALTNDRLSEATGLSRGLVNYQFRTRHLLYEAVVTSVRTDFLTDLVHSDTAAARTGRDAILHLVDTYLSELVRDPRRNTIALMLTIASLNERPELQDAVRDLTVALRDGIQGLLKRGQDDESISDSIDTTAASTIIVAILRGITIQWLADPDHVELATARREATAIIRIAYGG